MSDTELAHIEGTTSNEDLNLVAKQEKQKHASYSEKDDAKLLSDGTSDDGDEEDLVLEYSGLFYQSFIICIISCSFKRIYENNF